MTTDFKDNVERFRYLEKELISANTSIDKMQSKFSHRIKGSCERGLINQPRRHRHSNQITGDHHGPSKNKSKLRSDRDVPLWRNYAFIHSLLSRLQARDCLPRCQNVKMPGHSDTHTITKPLYAGDVLQL